MQIFEALLSVLPGMAVLLSLLGLSKKARVVLKSTLSHPMREDVIKIVGGDFKIMPKTEGKDKDPAGVA